MDTFEKFSRKSELEHIAHNFTVQLKQLMIEKPNAFDHAVNRCGLSSIESPNFSDFDKMLVECRKHKPSITLDLFSSLLVSDLGLIGDALTRVENLGEALSLMNSYHSMTSDKYNASMERIDDWVFIKATPFFGSNINKVEVVEEHFAGTWNLIKQLIQNPIDRDKLCIQCEYTEPEYGRKYYDLFGHNLHFEQSYTVMKFPAKWLTLPLAHADRASAVFFKNLCHRVLGKQTHQADTINQIRILLLSRNKREILTLEEVAEKLSVSVAQLRKRLYRQGTSYKTIVLEVRMTMATNYLSATTLSVKEVAYLLGYTHSHSFSRAFKAYYGYCASSMIDSKRNH